MADRQLVNRMYRVVAGLMREKKMGRGKWGGEKGKRHWIKVSALLALYIGQIQPMETSAHFSSWHVRRLVHATRDLAPTLRS